jgi:ferritin-like metal-binding protein YciE
MALATLNDLFVEQLGDLYDAEKQLTQALPKMAAAASSPDLERAFKDHLKQTEQHVQRLDQVFESISTKPPKHPCKAMRGLIAEGNEVIKEDGAPAVKDAALISAAQRVEHYEIAGYGNVRAFAEQLGYDTARALLDQTLTEESYADEKLTKLAQGGLLQQAQRA